MVLVEAGSEHVAHEVVFESETGTDFASGFISKVELLVFHIWGGDTEQGVAGVFHIRCNCRAVRFVAAALWRKHFGVANLVAFETRSNFLGHLISCVSARVHIVGFDVAAAVDGHSFEYWGWERAKVGVCNLDGVETVGRFLGCVVICKRPDVYGIGADIITTVDVGASEGVCPGTFILAQNKSAHFVHR